jgi:hypothetical protein
VRQFLWRELAGPLCKLIKHKNYCYSTKPFLVDTNFHIIWHIALYYLISFTFYHVVNISIWMFVRTFKHCRHTHRHTRARSDSTRLRVLCAYTHICTFFSYPYPTKWGRYNIYLFIHIAQHNRKNKFKSAVQFVVYLGCKCC